MDQTERLLAALKDAIEGMEDMIDYVPDSARKKWQHDGYLERARAAVAEHDRPG